MTAMTDKPRLLIVDDSSLFRKLLSKMIAEDGSMEVAGMAGNGREALEKLETISPDVVVLDVNMPVMSGITALKHIMIKTPTPTVMFSSLTRAGATVTFDALKCGAVDFIEKPSSFNGESMADQRAAIRRKIQQAAEVKVGKIRVLRQRPPKAHAIPDAQGKPDYVFAVGASEGGMASLLRIIPSLDAGLPVSIITVLYEEPEHVAAFAAYLDEHSAFRVKKAEHGDFITRGTCYLASGKDYVTIVGSNSRKGHALRVAPSPFPGRRGSVNMLMFSLAEAFEQNAAGLLLSGAGTDGSEGLREIARLGGVTLAQDPETCLSEEMVRQALGESVVHFTYPDSRLAEKINDHFSLS